MTNEQIIKEQKAWIASGKIGCVFASALVKIADKIGWKFQVVDDRSPWGHHVTNYITEKTFIASMIFPGHSAQSVRNWALNNGFYIEEIKFDLVEDLTGNEIIQPAPWEGLRTKIGGKVSWVQYFGPDSHVKTRQAPYPMLSFTCKLPAHVYAKTMAVGIMHLAHASIEFLTAKKCDTLWEQSYAKTKKELGHSPSAAEAAKVTFLK